MAKATLRGGKGKEPRVVFTSDHSAADAAHHALQAANFHYQRLGFWLARLKEDASWKDPGLTPYGEENFAPFHYHLRSFFWEEIAAFDALLQAINHELRLEIETQAVSWTTVAQALGQKPELDRFAETLNATYESEWFTNLRDYRNLAHLGLVVAEAFTATTMEEPKRRETFVMLHLGESGRGSGDAMQLAKLYGERLQEFITRTLADLDEVTTARPEPH